MEERYTVVTAFPHENLRLTKRQIIDLSKLRGDWWIFIDHQIVDETTLMDAKLDTKESVITLTPPCGG